MGRKTRAKGREDAGKRKQSVERCRNEVERFEAGNCTLSLSLVLPPRSLDRVSNRTHHPGSVMLKCRSKAGKRSRQNKASRRRKERKSRENTATVREREEKEEGECGRAVKGGFFLRRFSLDLVSSWDQDFVSLDSLTRGALRRRRRERERERESGGVFLVAPELGSE